MNEIKIDSVTYSKLYQKMKNEGIEKSISIDIYVQNILNDIVKDISSKKNILTKNLASTGGYEGGF